MVDDRDKHTELATIDGRRTASDDPTGSADREVKKTSGDRYRVVNRLGKGGMGEVMQVRDEIVGREVALKRIRRIEPSDRVVQRFLREASIQGRLEHPSIVPLYDIGRDPAGLPFFTMKKLTGTTLSKILSSEGPEFTVQRLLRAFSEVCLAVEFAHVRGIIHRDLKPDNIVLGDFGEVYVLDWGVAKVIGESDAEFSDVSSGSSEDNEHATVPGTAVGTPGFMPPEQVRGDVDARADVYALGCLLFQILTRSMLHPAGKAGLASAEVGIDARPSLRAPNLAIPPELDELCVEATHIDRRKRIQTARELGDRVQSYLDGESRRRDASQARGRAPREGAGRVRGGRRPPRGRDARGIECDRARSEADGRRGAARPPDARAAADDAARGRGDDPRGRCGDDAGQRARRDLRLCRLPRVPAVRVVARARGLAVHSSCCPGWSSSTWGCAGGARAGTRSARRV